MPGSNALTACVIAKNEEGNLRDCLEGLRFCDEIVVVVDAESTDGTVEIARGFTDRVFSRPWPGYVEQRSFAAEQATHDWVLFLDADERCPAEARRSIEKALSAPDPPCAGYTLRRLSRYLGRWIRHGGWYPDRKLRLYRRSQGEWTGRRVHERVQVKGAVGDLDAELLHFPYPDLASHVRTIDHYSTLAALDKADRGRTPRFLRFRLIGTLPYKFVRMYVVQRGFLDGLPGLICAVMGSYYVFLKYAKLWSLRAESRATPDA